MKVDVRFHAELNDFVPYDRRGGPISVDVAAGTTAKDAAESLGVPHTEIDVILVNGESVDFSRQLAPGDRMNVYPGSEAPAVTPIIHLLPPPPPEPRFVLDVHLGRLARYLRLLGFDAAWSNDATDEELAAMARRDARIVLTRDRGLLKRSSVTHGYFVRETRWRSQITEVLHRFDLFDAIAPFGRCLDCNGLLDPVAKAEVEHSLPPRTRRDYEEFKRCRDCGNIYWQGSHYDRLRAVVDGVRGEGRRGTAIRDRRLVADAALAACHRGWSVVPLHAVVAGRCSCGDAMCPAPGKHPRIAWDRLAREAAGAEEVEHWWRRWPRANLGVVTGVVSGIVVLDVDPRHGGGNTLAEFEAIHGALPHTVEVLTGGGGQHLYFCHPGPRVPSRPVMPGLDIKGDGGLVVAPPSIHVSGRAYAWESGCAPGEVELAAMPPWLLAMALDTDGSPSRAASSASEPITRTDGERREFAELWAQVGVTLRPGDHNYLCPFHADHHPSLHVDAEGCRFYCFGCARGGGIGRLRRLVGARGGTAGALPPGGPTLEVVSPEPGSITLPGETMVDVVGESRHQDVLLELTGGRRHYGGVRMATVARLDPQPDNAADPEAIVVTIDGRTVGYLSRADAVRYRQVITDAIGERGEASCAAMIVGGWERAHGDIGYFGVRLRL